MEIYVQVGCWGVLSGKNTVREWGKKKDRGGSWTAMQSHRGLKSKAMMVFHRYPKLKQGSHAFRPSCQLDPGWAARSITLNETAPFSQGQLLSRQTQLSAKPQANNTLPASVLKRDSREDSPQYPLHSTLCALRFIFYYNKFISLETSLSNALD